MPLLLLRSCSGRTARTGGSAVRCVAVALLGLAAATGQTASAQIASGTTGIDSTGNAKSEMAACLNGTTQQAQETCMTEMRNAGAEKRAGKLGDSADLSANAMKRCEVFQKPDDQAACKARVLEEHKAQGGVAAGGVLRESETAVPASGAGPLPVRP